MTDIRARLTHARSPYLAALGARADAAFMTPKDQPYFSIPSEDLDPRLFEGDQLRPEISHALQEPLDQFIRSEGFADDLFHPYLAGSGVSRYWHGHGPGGDLDVLIDVDFNRFRREMGVSWSNNDIAEMLNSKMKSVLWPQMEDWRGFEVTYYVNPRPLIDIKPYAAVSLRDGIWLVPPSDRRPVDPVGYTAAAQEDTDRATSILDRYHHGLAAVETFPEGHPHRVTALALLAHAMEEGASFFHEIHNGRKVAFSAQGSGWEDWHNYRWQSGKKAGWLPALAKMSKARAEAQEAVVRGSGASVASLLTGALPR